ncbi:Fur family transcriptional regulator [Microbulbifer thermotolerans]|uniref:Fur family transcriptional regulator n=1 Tax=Microbulbifer thermotolerans TaxID=252514 RepID=A0A143HM03_MICTH|nr:transcriptional repressor [Microbulbifer thermotolerans]AMX02561.1 Fur family transcriptional regulator [Microbulbifer thermotolerans]MCX2779423.1 transcriptional repressor [Microbulbifer thermotolerans]MCX2782369.1 transcriptional repressor [Microbulbifer thermotolerans]MCX2794958.1 transcriptional repressor [Microbulbifer thermotolerans]MCX2800522.1 transcriptional repressor [Microbulbifer thermotolerans]
MNASELKRNLSAAEQSCRISGARLTEKRRNILTVLLRAKTPLSAYEIADQYRVDFGEPIPAMSVYRMLDFLVDENLAHKLNSENKYLACAHIACDHRHETPQFLICSRCSKVREIGIKPEVIAALRETVEAAGYHLQTSQLELDCLCDECGRSAA